MTTRTSAVTPEILRDSVVFNTSRTVRNLNITGRQYQYDRGLLSTTSQSSSTHNSSYSNISSKVSTSTPTVPSGVTSQNIFVSTNSNNGLVYNIRNKLWYPSSQPDDPSSSQGLFSVQSVTRPTIFSTYYPVQLTTPSSLESSVSYRREKYLDTAGNVTVNNARQIPREIIVKSSDIEVTGKTRQSKPLIAVIADIKTRQVNCLW